MDLSDYNEIKRQKVLIYGPPKAGKTAFVGKLAEEGYTLYWMDLESGIKTLLNPEILKPEFRQNIKVVNIPDTREVPVGFDAIRRTLRGGKVKFCYKHGVHQCPLCLKESTAKWADEFDLNTFGDKDVLVIDSWSQATDSAANKITLKEWKKDDEYKLSFNDYGAQGMYLKEVLSRIQASNANICVLAHEVDGEKSDSKEKIVPMSGTRNFSLTVAKYFDEVVHMHVLNKKHSAHNATTWSNTHVTGGRSGVIVEEGGKGLKDIFAFGNQVRK